MKNIPLLHRNVCGIAVRRLRGAVSACFSLALVLALATAARAELFIETKLTASGLAADDYFGNSVGISGNTAIVGGTWWQQRDIRRRERLPVRRDHWQGTFQARRRRPLAERPVRPRRGR